MREFLVSALRESNARNLMANATKVTFLAKTKTLVQLFTIAIFLFGLIFDYALIMFLANFFILLSLLITIYTGIEYFLNSYYANNYKES
jgi:phosphatidylglycerophosphate synthase